MEQEIKGESTQFIVYTVITITRLLVLHALLRVEFYTGYIKQSIQPCLIVAVCIGYPIGSVTWQHTQITQREQVRGERKMRSRRKGELEGERGIANQCPEGGDCERRPRGRRKVI